MLLVAGGFMVLAGVVKMFFFAANEGALVAFFGLLMIGGFFVFYHIEKKTEPQNELFSRLVSVFFVLILWNVIISAILLLFFSYTNDVYTFLGAALVLWLILGIIIGFLCWPKFQTPLDFPRNSMRGSHE